MREIRGRLSENMHDLNVSYIVSRVNPRGEMSKASSVQSQRRIRGVGEGRPLRRTLGLAVGVATRKEEERASAD